VPEKIDNVIIDGKICIDEFIHMFPKDGRNSVDTQISKYHGCPNEKNVASGGITSKTLHESSDFHSKKGFQLFYVPLLRTSKLYLPEV